MSTPHEKKQSMHRTSLITAVAIAGVVLAGTVAVGANIGILNAADDSDIGNLSAAGDLVPADTQVVDVYLDEASTTTTDTATLDSAVAQEFAVDAAGTVAVIPAAGALRLGDVAANPGWTWSLAQSDASALAVTFTDGVRTLVFTAVLGPDGTITAAVEEPIVSVSSIVPTAQGEYEDDDDEYDDDEYDDDEYEYDDDDEYEHEDEDEEHEGRDDDD